MTVEPWLPPAGAGIIAALFAFVELKSAVKMRITWRAWHWVAARIGLEGLLGAGLFFVMESATDVDRGRGTLIPVLLAGVGAPILPRMQFSLGVDGPPLGFSERYAKWLVQVAQEIDDICSRDQSSQMWDRIVPNVASFQINELCERTRTYLRAKSLPAKELERAEEFIDALLIDDDTDVATKRATLMQKLMDLGGTRQARELARAGKREARRAAKHKHS